MGLVSQDFDIVRSPDGTFDSDFPAGDKPPGGTELTWSGAVAGLLAAGITEMEVGTPFIHDVRQYLSGTEAATAEITLIHISGDEPIAAGFSEPAFGDDLEYDAVAPGSGAFRLAATGTNGIAVPGATRSWACTAAPIGASFGVAQSDPGYGRPTIVPGGRGFGMDSFGGSGRHLATPATTVLYVNSLSTGTTGSGNAGTLKWCLTRTFPRVIVPAISGCIDFGLGGTVTISNPYFTYAGQCAPGDGLIWYNLRILVTTHNGLLWHAGMFMGDAESQPLGNNFQIGANGFDVHHVVVANSDMMFGHDQAWQIFLANDGSTTNNCVWQCNVSLAQIGPGFVDGQPTSEQGPWGFGCLVSLYNQKIGSKASVLRCMWLKNFRRSPAVSEGSAEYSNNFIYDGDFGTEVKVHNAGGGANTKHNIRNNVYVKGPNGLDQGNSCIMLTANSIFEDGGEFCIDGNRKFSDYQVAQLIFNSADQPITTTPNPEAEVPGFELLDIPDNDADMIAFAHTMAEHCGMRPAHRITYVQDLVDGMLAYMDGGTDTVARIEDRTFPMDPDPPGWPITLSTQGETIDHETTGSHGVGVIPTVGKDVVQASGYTLLEEWLHLHADWAMGGTGWRL